MGSKVSWYPSNSRGTVKKWTPRFHETEPQSNNSKMPPPTDPVTVTANSKLTDLQNLRIQKLEKHIPKLETRISEQEKRIHELERQLEDANHSDAAQPEGKPADGEGWKPPDAPELGVPDS